MSRPSTVSCCQENVGQVPLAVIVPPSALRSMLGVVGRVPLASASALMRSRRA